jgi:Cof subfamily protein (haloacid dehalogenase superfamily)
VIKAIFFDIDGTLLSFKTHRLSPGTCRAFDELKRRGILTFISSGRPQVLIPEMPIHFDGYITVNGGYCFMGEKVILSNPLNPDDATNWLKYVDEHKLVTMLFSHNEMFVNRVDDAALRLRSQLEFKMPPLLSTADMRGREVYQFIAMIPADKDEEVLQLLPHSRLPRWHPAFSDLIPQNSSKARGIEQIALHLGLQRNELMAFGDGGNDIEMLDYVGLGVAMGNSTKQVQQHAQYVTTDVDHEGILNALTTLKVI